MGAGRRNSIWLEGQQALPHPRSRLLGPVQQTCLGHHVTAAGTWRGVQAPSFLEGRAVARGRGALPGQHRRHLPRGSSLLQGWPSLVRCGVRGVRGSASVHGELGFRLSLAEWQGLAEGSCETSRVDQGLECESERST